VSGLSIDHDDPGRGTLSRPLARIKRTARFAVVVLGLLTARASAEADPGQDAHALLERGLAHIHDVGRDQAFADFSRPDGAFIAGQLYIFCLDASGVIVASGGSPQMIGHNLADARGPDGRLAIVEVIQLGLSKGSGWLEFSWPNPATKRIEPKTVYVLKVDDHTVCGSGYYANPR
jgi:hypothetical protein